MVGDTCISTEGTNGILVPQDACDTGEANAENLINYCDGVDEVTGKVFACYMPNPGSVGNRCCGESLSVL